MNIKNIIKSFLNNLFSKTTKEGSIMNRPVTTLFLLMSMDGKISTGDTDTWDVDKDIPNIDGDPATGLHQYYEEEQETDLWCLNSGRVLAKVGMNNAKGTPKKTPVTFAIIDNNHLADTAIRFFSQKGKQVVIVTSNSSHPGFELEKELNNVKMLKYSGQLNPKQMLHNFKKLGCDAITIQTGGTLNEMFLRHHLIDKVNIVMFPCLVGGKNTATLIDGNGPKSLKDIGVLKLTQCKPLKNSYVQLKYDVVNADKK